MGVTLFLLCLQLSLTAGEELEIEDEVDGWYYVSIIQVNMYHENCIMNNVDCGCGSVCVCVSLVT